jgi:hypothetical protein
MLKSNQFSYFVSVWHGILKTGIFQDLRVNLISRYLYANIVGEYKLYLYKF